WRSRPRRHHCSQLIKLAGEGNRTLVSSLGSWRSAIELHPQKGRREGDWGKVNRQRSTAAQNRRRSIARRSRRRIVVIISLLLPYCPVALGEATRPDRWPRH